MSQQSTPIEELVQGFAKHIKALKSPETKEATIRQNYIDPFWRALGWDVGDTQQRGPTEAEVIIEKNIETAESTGLRNRRPDYLFRLGGFPRFVVEAKKPAIDIDDDKNAIFQCKQYAWNSTIPFAVLTDFEQFRLYDTTLMPIFQEPRRGLVKEFSLDYGSYEAQWDVLLSTFGRAAVADGSLERLLAQVKKIRAGRRIRTVDRMLYDFKGNEPVDHVFLAYLDTHRRHFAADIYRHNKSVFPEADTLHGAAKLTEAVQRLMDRLVFMRVCEDRDIIPFGSLRKSLERVGTEGGEFYETLVATFRELDIKYNGYLYKPHFSEQLKVDGSVLADFTRTLYPPDSPWDFAAIGDDILGIVYERFLGNVVTVNQGQVELQEKLEVRHAGGVYYTPRFVVDTIIRRVVGPKLQGKTPAQVLDLKILDPACGSGSFLVAALQYLFDYCLAAVHADPKVAKDVVPALAEGLGSKGRKKKSEIAFRDREGRWHLAPDFRAALLTHCIHGVDIDQQAVEVTVMSLYLKMLESKLPENWATLWVEHELLPSLDNNIQCGNSLIDSAAFDDFIVEKHGGLFPVDDDVRFRINRFDWTSRTRGFGRLLDSHAVKDRGRVGFDCIIGNPPYIRVQELNKWAPEECEFYKWNYKAAAKGNYDIYVVFTERALSLLAPDGLLGFIMPHKWWQAQYGEGLRKIVADGKHLKAVVDFGDQQVFKGATTYTAIHVLSRDAGKKSVDYAKVLELDDGEIQCRAIEAARKLATIRRFPAGQPSGAANWAFLNTGVSAFMAQVAANGPTLGNYADKIFVGLQTSADQVFILERRGKRFWSEQLGVAVDLEATYLHPLLKGSVHMKRWLPLASPQVVLFPYERKGKAFELVSATEFRKNAPLTWDYMLQCRPHLASRERGTFEGDRWYGYVYPKNLASMSKRKLLTPSLGQRAEFCFDPKGDQFFVGSGGGGGGGYGILLPDPKLYEYVLGLLNSKLLDWYLQQITTPFHSGWFAYNKQFIDQIAIKLPTTAADKKLAERITQSVRAIMDAKAKLRAADTPFSGVKGRLKPAGLSDRETKSLESEVEAHERRIDESVFALYGVDGLPE